MAGSDGKLDLSKLSVQPLSTSLNPSNIKILENHGLDGRSGYWCLKFQFDYELERGIVIRLCNFKYDGSGDIWSLEIEKCHYLKISDKNDLVSFDIVDKLININEMERLRQSASTEEKLRKYLEDNVIPLIKQKIKYTKYVPKFQFFLSHKSKDKPQMRSFKEGLNFLGYLTWLDETNMKMGSTLALDLKISVEKCDCFIAWLNEEYFKSDYCSAELLYAKQLGKIIIPFGVFSEVKASINENENLKFLNDLYIANPHKMSFFEILRRIDETLYNFEKMAFPCT
ncbi:uncharacterized protein LOC124454456 [Xenia sp. Carnegie-2017]|uniref:uncharacterized protein LOC124454456 n=1 Tax=Xenia sp. Carnegie-2017 TaxID=2897299 RepID=UPI001F039C6B|nr:uncharacterized protein LOC124454456 [Xenia sp. Carnegie-2017]